MFDFFLEQTLNLCGYGTLYRTLKETAATTDPKMYYILQTIGVLFAVGNLCMILAIAVHKSLP